MITKSEEVKIVQIGGIGTKQVKLEGNDRTVRTVLTNAGVNFNGQEVRVNNRAATLDQVLNHADTVLLLQKVQGNVTA
jgi:hypothetical protein